MSHTYKFELGQLVSVDGVDCIICEREIDDGAPDYICTPVDGSQKIFGLESSWCRESVISPIGLTGNSEKRVTHE